MSASNPAVTTVVPAGPMHRFLTVSLARELGILLSLTLLFPFLIHILPVPEDARLGPRLLPMFYAPLLGALLGRPRSAVAVALAAPWLNWALTGHPAPRGGIVMTVQLLVFVLVLRALLMRVGARGLLAVPAYFASVGAGALLAAVVPALIGGRAILPWVTQSVATAIPGIVILALINWLVVRTYPSGPEGGGPLTA